MFKAHHLIIIFDDEIIMLQNKIEYIWRNALTDTLEKSKIYWRVIISKKFVIKSVKWESKHMPVIIHQLQDLRGSRNAFVYKGND